MIFGLRGIGLMLINNCGMIHGGKISVLFSYAVEFTPSSLSPSSSLRWVAGPELCMLTSQCNYISENLSIAKAFKINKIIKKKQKNTFAF